MLPFNSRQRLFLGILKSRWTGPCTVAVAFPYGVIKIMYHNDSFVVNGAHLKQYYPSIPVPIFRKSEKDVLVQDVPKPNGFVDEP